METTQAAVLHSWHPAARLALSSAEPMSPKITLFSVPFSGSMYINSLKNSYSVAHLAKDQCHSPTAPCRQRPGHWSRLSPILGAFISTFSFIFLSSPFFLFVIIYLVSF